jgi:Protein of unknown function (DUF2934)
MIAGCAWQKNNFRQYHSFMNEEQRQSAGRPSNGTTLSTANHRGPQPSIPSHQAIEKRAYEIWLSHNRETGCEQKHWLDAEKQLRQVTSQS